MDEVLIVVFPKGWHSTWARGATSVNRWLDGWMGGLMNTCVSKVEASLPKLVNFPPQSSSTQSWAERFQPCAPSAVCAQDTKGRS